jgi:site-specific recombinase XerD
LDQQQKEVLHSLGARFNSWLEAINYSPKTRVNYARDVHLYLEWLAENTDISQITDVTPAHLRQYQIALSNLKSLKGGKHLSIGSQACKLAAVRSLFSWLVREQRITINPTSGLVTPRQPRRLPRDILSRKEALSLIEDTPGEKPLDVRDKAILEVLYGTGIRRAELIGLKICDVDFDSSTLRVEHGKGNRTRIVPLISSAHTALKLYTEKARGIFARESGQLSLFVSTRSGGPLDDADIVRIVKKAVKRARITKHVTPHTLRHTCATHLLKGKADIRQIQKLLGHQRLSSTEIYTHVEIGDLHRVVKRCHPRGTV